MIVASWSIVHGQTCSTSNMIAVAAAISMKNNLRCILTQTHFNLNNLESYLMGSKDAVYDGLMDNGIDGLASVIKLRPLDKETVENYSVPVIAKKLTLLPGTAGMDRKVYIDDMGKTASILLNEIDKYYDMVFVDVNSGSDEVTKLILDRADVIIVNLNQNRSVLDNFKKFWQMKGKKVLYLIGRYDKNSSYNLSNISGNLGGKYNFLKNDVTGIIPYNAGFMDAQSGGDVIKFFRKNMGAKSNNSYFIDNVNDAAGKLLKLANKKG